MAKETNTEIVIDADTVEINVAAAVGEKPTEKTPKKTPVISDATKELGDKMAAMIESIDPVTGSAVLKKDAKFADLLPADLSMEAVTKTIGLMASVANAGMYGVGNAAVKFTGENPNVAGVTARFPGPVDGSHLDVSYKRKSSVPSRDGETKIYHGTMSASWKNLTGPGGEDYDAIKASIHRLAEAQEASKS